MRTVAPERGRGLPDVPVWLRWHGEDQAARPRLERLLEAVDRMLDDGAVEVEERPPGRRVWVFGAIGYRVNPKLRHVVTCFRIDGRPVYQPGVFQLFRPLCTSYWLRPLIWYLGLSPGHRQRDLFLDQCNIRSLEDWLAEAAWRRIRGDERFKRLRTHVLPQALALDPELVSIALASRTNAESGLTSSVFNRVWRNEAAYRRVARENPRLLPLVDAAFQAERIAKGEDPVGGLRRIFLESDLRPAAWRYVVRHGTRFFAPAWRLLGRQPLKRALQLMHCLQAAGLPPPFPPALTNAVLGCGTEAGDVLGMVIRAAHAAVGTPAYADFPAQAQRVLDWAQLNLPALDKRQRRAGWPWALRQADAWERRRALNIEGPRTWPSAVGESLRGRYRIVPLDSVELMVEEALAMRNCLVECIPHCQSGAERFFSVREASTGDRLADFHLVLNPETKRWRLGQAKGPCNARIPTEIGNLAYRISVEYEALDAGPREIAEPEWLQCLEEAVAALPG